MKRNVAKLGGKAPTIKDIAEKLNISSVSVHRALAGKEGVSEKLRAQILQTAKEMGYEVNYAAASLKRKVCQIAVVLPQDVGKYYAYIWDGIWHCEKEVRGLNIEVQEQICCNEEHQYELLKTIADSDMYSGVITILYTRNPKILMQLQRLIAKNIMTVVIDEDLKEPEGLYCIPANDVAVGQVAGELMSLIAPNHGTVLVTSQRKNSEIRNNKIASFCRYMKEKKPELKICVVDRGMDDAAVSDVIYHSVKEQLKKIDDIVACYFLTSSDNEPTVQAIKDSGKLKEIMIIGTDFNELTSQMLARGELRVVINQAAYKKGYMGLHVLVDKVIKNIDPPLRLDSPIDVILKSNAGYYENLNKI